MDDQILTFVLLAIGFVLLGIELMIPSGGVIGIICVGSFLGSAYFAYQSWAETNPLYWRIYITTFVALIPLTLYGIYYLLTRTRFGSRILLTAPTKEEVTPYQAERKRLESLIGQRGKAISPLRPGGLVMVNGERLHATGNGFIIESGTPIEIVRIDGARVIVQPVVNSEPATPPVDAEPQIPEAHPEREIVDPFSADETA